MLKKFFPVFTLVIASQLLFSQQEIGLHFMRDVWQSNETNPAIARDSGGVFRLPGFFNGLAFDGPHYRQLVSRVNGESVINISEVISHLDDENIIRDDFTLNTIGFGLPIKKKWFFSFGHSVRYHAFFKYPKTLPQVIYEGNAQFIGESVSIGNELQLSGFHSVEFGLSRKLSNLTVGAKAKFLTGFVDMTTDPNHTAISLYTDPDIYQITLDGDYILNTSNSLDYQSYDDFSFDLNFGTFTTDRFFDGNTGWAFDLGARYETEKWDFSASILDLSNGITWKRRVVNYVVQDSFYYEGLNFSDAISGGDSPDFDATLDSIEQIFQPEKRANSYTSQIPQKIYLSALYRLTGKTRLGVVYFNQSFHNENYFALGFHGNMDLTKWLNAGLTYSLSSESYDNIGTSVLLRGKVFQAFFVSDNILDVFRPVSGNNFAVRIGGNLHF